MNGCRRRTGAGLSCTLALSLAVTSLAVAAQVSVGGNLTNQRGEWALARHDHATRVTYRANISPGFALPPLIGPAIVGRDVQVMVESVAREMLRRGQATER